MPSRASTSPRELSAPLSSLFVDTVKTLAIDAVQKANSGHPGMPMGAAVMGSVLWTRFLVHDPDAPQWPDRDRFVLSAGHGSMLLYALLHLTGYDLPLAELQRFRQWGSKTPGHPEHGHTVGVEVTTGPLGTGLAAAVGMALAERHLGTVYNRPGHTIVDHLTYGICSDGDLMEGIASEAASLAGHLGLGKLIFLYDDNKISIDGSTDLAFTEDVLGRFAAYGWHVQRVDGHDPAQVAAALTLARADQHRPSLIACRTVIAHGSPNKAGTHGAHGAPLGADEITATRKALGWALDRGDFHVPDEVRGAMQGMRAALTEQRRDWEQRFEAYRKDHPKLAAQFEALQRDAVPEEVLAAIPKFSPGSAIATRKANQKILEAVVKAHPTFIGGSADLAGSNGVELKGTSHSKEHPEGRILHFGVREHGMGGLCNGIAVHGGLRVYDATFLVFSDFMRGALRLSALMKLPVIHIFSHDSFWVGEDGPTHQPIEHVMSLRLIPDLYVIRPGDARETAAAWRLALQRGHGDGPTAILLTRQDLPIMAETHDTIDEGAYVLWEPEGGPVEGILVATGSEVATALAAAKALHADHQRRVRVVSMPCWEAFLAQPQAYRDQVLPPEISRRLSVEAGTTFGWDRFAPHHHGIDHYGASAPGKLLAEQFGFTPEALVRRWLELP